MLSIFPINFKIYFILKMIVSKNQNIYMQMTLLLFLIIKLFYV